LFDNIWSAEDFNLKKSEPYVFLEAAKKLGANPNDCCMVDDNLIALTAAKKAGLKVVGVYDSYSAEYEDEIRGLADAYLREMEEMLALDI
jgi:beta-phosphoglucomutase-like phosphatase (HAD superfamily)